MISSNVTNFLNTLFNTEELQKLWNFETYNDLIPVQLCLIIAMFNYY